MRRGYRHYPARQWLGGVALVAVALGGCSETAPDDASSAQAATVQVTAPVAPAEAPAEVGAAAATQAGIEGLWKLTIDTPMGVQHPLLSVRDSGDGYSATYTGRQGELLIENLSFDGTRFAFPLTITVPIGQIEVTYEGAVQGDQMAGVVQNPRGQVPFSGSRQ